MYGVDEKSDETSDVSDRSTAAVLGCYGEGYIACAVTCSLWYIRQSFALNVSCTEWTPFAPFFPMLLRIHDSDL